MRVSVCVCVCVRACVSPRGRQEFATFHYNKFIAWRIPWCVAKPQPLVHFKEIYCIVKTRDVLTLEEITEVDFKEANVIL